MPGIEHGTITGYGKYRCGCDPCYEAYEGNRDRTKARKRSLSENVTPIRSTSMPAPKLKRRNGIEMLQDEANEYLAEMQAEYERRHLELEALYIKDIGEVEQSVLDECAGLSLSEERPAMVTTACRLAHILDDPKQVALHPTTSRQLTAILNDLRGNSKKRTRSRLASVQRLVSESSSDTG